MKKSFSRLFSPLLLCPLAVLLPAWLTAQTPDADGTVYVKAAATGTGTGNSWANATADLQGAINAVGVQKVFVAIGNYNVPSPNSFVMKNNVAVYGGFDPANGINDLSQSRIMPGAGLQGSILNGKNERPIIWNYDNGLTATALLDGFTLTKGTGTYGGAIHNRGSSPTLSNLLVKGNNATYGGGIFNDNAAAPVLVNVAIVNNKATGLGGGFYNNSGIPVLTNVTIANDTAGMGAAMYTNGGTPQLRNAILFGSISGPYTAQYSFIEGNTVTANNNLNTASMVAAHVFVNALNGNYGLVAGSPVIDKGDNTSYTGGGSADLAGHARVGGSKIDLGAYELSATLPDANGTVYIRTTGTGSGKSWADAGGDLQAAINAAGVQQVWVDKGTYEVSANSFTLKNGVAIYGGFDPDNGISTLSHSRILPFGGGGSILQGRNERPVLWNHATAGSPMDTTAKLDGFTLIQGNGINDNGGAINNSYASPRLSNLVIRNNVAGKGAGVYNANSSAPVFTKCVFRDNQATGSGGAMCNDNSKPILVNCLLYHNTAYLGGAIGNPNNAYPNLINCTVANNHANGYGGAVSSLAYSNPAFLNCIVYGNTATMGSNGLDKDVTVGANNLNFYYSSLIQDATAYDIDGNLSFVGTITDIFNDPANNDYTLKPGSPAINMGHNGFATNASLTTDLAGNTRIRGSSVDLGVYETETCATNATLYVDSAVLATGNGAGWPTAYRTLKEALDMANSCVNVTEIRVAKGTYYPSGQSGVLYERDSSFTITRSNLRIMGGYSAATGLRDAAANPTLLSGEAGSAATTADDCYHVMVLAGVPATDSLIIDGFTIASGNADNANDYRVIDGSYYIFHDGGAGMYLSTVGSNLAIRNCTFSSNTATLGGALYSEFSYAGIQNCRFSNNRVYNDSYFPGSGAAIYATASDHGIANTVFQGNSNLGGDGGALLGDGAGFQLNSCLFTGNTALGNGGGVVTSSPPSTFTNCRFTGNTAGSNGGAVYNNSSNAVLTNVAMTGNSATSGGGAFYSANGGPALNNVTIAGNTAGTAGSGAVYIASGTPQFSNSILFGGISSSSYTARYSLIEGSNAVTNGNLNATGITAAQVFTNAAAGDYTVRYGSPVLNRGSNAAIPSGIDTDVLGNARIANGTVDMGAYELPFYYSTGSNDAAVLANWKTSANGTGSSPASFAVATVFTVQAGHAVSANSPVDFGNATVIVSPNGAITGNYGNITGTVTLQQLIFGQRGWRIFANPFTTAQPIPAVAATNGITINTTPQASGLTDSRIFSNANNAWSNVTGNSWAANTPYGLFIRGLAGEVTGLNYTAGPSLFVYSVSGTLNGNSTSIVPASAANFLVAGNPYAAPVTTQALTGGSSRPYYTYQIMPGANQAAQRTVAGSWVPASTNSSTTATIPVLGVLAFKPASTALYQVTSSDINTNGTVQGNLFREAGSMAQLELVVEQDGEYRDKLFVRLDGEATATAADNNDLKKLYNDQTNFYSLTTDRVRMAIDARSGFDTLPLGISAVAGSYGFRPAGNSLPSHLQPVLRDEWLGTETALQTGQLYPFSITADAASKGEQRFRLIFKKVKPMPSLSTVFTAQVLGNPVKGPAATLTISGSEGPVTVTVTDAVGRVLNRVHTTNGLQKIPLPSTATGMLYLRISDGSTTVVRQVIKE